ncbi:MAG: D-2-hydroxyacid dehydrogenase [Bacteroidales bacterium]|nr:D-2-hydroxyacid dehydrogenase [Bacteroidales bacterium]
MSCTSLNIVVLDGFCLSQNDLSWTDFEQLGHLIIYPRTPQEEVLPRIKDAQVVITNKTVLSNEIIKNSPKLKYIGVLATGYNVVDVACAKAHGIVVTNVPAYSTQSVAQLVFAHLLNITNHVAHYAEKNRNGHWSACGDFSYADTPLIELAGKKMGIVGMGNTGQATAAIAQALGMKVYVYSSKPYSYLPDGVTKLEIDDIFRQCDVVSLHCPLTKDTQGLVDARRLALMKRSAILINTARGGLVNEQDLADALNGNLIMAAAVDVLGTEPPKPDNPLLTAKNCYITPHIAWATFEARKRLMSVALDNVKAFLVGKTMNNVAV